MPVVVSIDFADLKKQVEGFRRNQIPFALSLALNKTLKQWRDHERQVTLPKTFTIRTKGKSGIASGIRIEFSSKKKLSGAIGSIDPFMKQQAEGGLRRKLKGLAIPIIKREVRGSQKQRTPKSKWPGAILKKQTGNRPFVVTFKSGHRAVVKRRKRPGRTKGKRHTRSRRLPLDVLWLLPKRVPIKPIWELEKSGLSIVNTVWADNVIKSFKFAIATAKKKRRKRKR